MTDDHNTDDSPEGPGEDGGGFDADDWSRLKPFTGRVATLVTFK